MSKFVEVQGNLINLEQVESISFELVAGNYNTPTKSLIKISCVGTTLRLEYDDSQVAREVISKMGTLVEAVVL